MSTRIVVLADTHMPRRAKELPSSLLDDVRTADLVIHLGDFTTLTVADALRSLSKLEAVHGNNDSDEVRNQFPAARTIDIHGFRVRLIHGDKGGRTAVESARRERHADVILFGHSHAPYCEQHEGRLLFNPGSPTDRRTAPEKTYGILTISTTVVPSILSIR